MANTLSKVYLIPDTNILIGNWKELVEKLKPYKGKIVIGLLQIPVEENLGSLYTLACRHDDNREKFLQNLGEIMLEFYCNEFDTEIVPIPCVLNVGRLCMCYDTGEDDKKLLSQAIQRCLAKRYKSTLQQIAKYCLKVDIEDNVEAFQEALRRCCDLSHSGNETCRSQCKTLYGILGDILLISGAYYVYRQQKASAIIVSNDKTVCEVVEGLSRDGYYDGRWIKCVSIEDIEKALSNICSNQNTKDYERRVKD